MKLNKHRILYLVTHPIQYQAPLMRLISQSKEIDIHAVFYWDKKTDNHFDVGFGREVVWDVPLLEGYSNQYLSETKQSRLQKLIALWKLIDKKQFDIVWTHGYADLYTIAAIVFAKLKGLKVFVRGESLYFPQDKKSFLYNKRERSEQIASNRSLRAANNVSKQGRFRFDSYFLSFSDVYRDVAGVLKRKCFFKILDQFVDRYLAIGTENKNFYIANKVPENKIFFCHYVVDNDFFRNQYLRAKQNSNALRESLGLEKGRPVILYASKFIERKYPIDLLNAYLQLPGDNRPYLLFIGTGETLDEVVRTANNDPNIRFLGFKNQSELPDYFALADVLVLPSKRENWGLIVNEAMSAECAIIVSDEVGCGVDLVTHGENGFIFKARDVAALSQYLKELTSDAGCCEQMKSKSAEIIAQWGLPEAVAGLEKAVKSLSKR